MVDYRDNPAVHIFADTEAALARMRQSAADAGCRSASAALIGASAETPELVPGAALLIELEAEGTGEAAIPMLDLARAAAERGAHRSVIVAPVALIDLIAARAVHRDIELLCQATEEERVAAVSRAIGAREARLYDSRRESDFPVLRPLAEPGAAVRGSSLTRADAAFIRTLLRTRRLRTHFFRADLFADPVWDMLLDLMAARLEGKQVAVSSLCIAAAVPPTTALRWIGVMTESGLVVRVADRNDGRRVNIELAEQTAHALAAWLEEARRLLGAVQ
jgi:DNA-binding MarR family transcriptional regulator